MTIRFEKGEIEGMRTKQKNKVKGREKHKKEKYITN